jgi:hypothetical protein
MTVRMLELVEGPDGVLLKTQSRVSDLTIVNGVLVHMGTSDTDVNWDSIVDSIREERAAANWLSK